MSAVFQDALEALLERARELAGSHQPCTALVQWLRAFVRYAGEYRGLSRALMSTPRDESSALGQCQIPMHAAGNQLLVRAQQAGAVRADVSIEDLLQLTNAIALASEQSPEDPELADRLLMLTLRGLAPGPAEGAA
jgi:purine-nucleoside phosphorylase